MTNKSFRTVSATAAAAIAVILLFGAAKHFASLNHSAVHSAEIAPPAELPNPALSRISLLVSNPN